MRLSAAIQRFCVAFIQLSLPPSNTPLGIMLIKALLFLLELIQRFSLRILLRYFLSVQFELSIYFKLPEHIRFIRP